MARRAEAARLEAETRLVDAASATPVLTRDDLGRPGLASVRAAIVARMTVRGVRDAEARSQRDRASAIETSFERALRSAVREAREGLVQRGEWVSIPGGARARVLETACGRRAIERAFSLLDASTTRCAVRLELETESEVDVDVIAANGELTSAVMRPDPADARRIELGFASRIEARTAILRVGRAERALLRLR
jgi:hypothetical protein